MSRGIRAKEKKGGAPEIGKLVERAVAEHENYDGQFSGRQGVQGDAFLMWLQAEEEISERIPLSRPKFFQSQRTLIYRRDAESAERAIKMKKQNRKKNSRLLEMSWETHTTDR